MFLRLLLLLLLLALLLTHGALTGGDQVHATLSSTHLSRSSLQEQSKDWMNVDTEVTVHVMYMWWGHTNGIGKLVPIRI